MPHFAEINTQTNEVLRVILAKSKLWCEYELDGTWFRTYYNTEGKNFAGMGWMYHPEKENFSVPQQYPSWTLDDNCIWQPPVSQPEGGGSYNWNEETQSWEENNLLS
jgi:hypothetical protein